MSSQLLAFTGAGAVNHGEVYVAKETGIQVYALLLCLQDNTSPIASLNKCWLNSRNKDLLSLDESLRAANTENNTFSRYLPLTTLLRFISVGPLPMDMLQTQLNSMIGNQTACFFKLIHYVFNFLFSICIYIF